MVREASEDVVTVMELAIWFRVFQVEEMEESSAGFSHGRNNSAHWNRARSWWWCNWCSYYSLAKEDENPQTPLAPNPSPNPKGEVQVVSQASSSHPLSNNNNTGDKTPSPNKPLNPEEFILSVASNIASQPLQYSDPDVWGVLTAISNNACKR